MLFTVLFLFSPIVSAGVLDLRQLLSGPAICSRIESQITGDVYLPTTVGANYLNGFYHYMTSSAQTPLCVVEVANANDISIVLKTVGETRIPFGVKSGGHASNPGFSSTPGVLISLTQLKQVIVSNDRKTVEIGMGNIWTDVYQALDGIGLNVVGGRVSGPGAGGFTLGGGFSWLTNQYGLTVDTVISFNLVLPNGTITTVDAAKPDLFFALKGGLNRFGIVSSMRVKAFPLPPKIYGGIQIFDPLQIPTLIKATERFQVENTDKKAQAIFTINGGVASQAILILFYDGPQRPPAFDVYNNIPFLSSTAKTQSFLQFVQSTPVLLTSGNRGAFHTLSTSSLTEGFMKAAFNESLFYSTLSPARGGVFISYQVEPFTKYGQFSTDSAFPHANSPLPFNVMFSWQGSVNDAYWRGVMQKSVDTLIEVAKREGIWRGDLYAYPNYAMSTYTGDRLYGLANVARLRKIRAEVDPENVMLLAGGFTI